MQRAESLGLNPKNFQCLEYEESAKGTEKTAKKFQEKKIQENNAGGGEARFYFEKKKVSNGAEYDRKAEE